MTTKDTNTEIIEKVLKEKEIPLKDITTEFVNGAKALLSYLQEDIIGKEGNDAITISSRKFIKKEQKKINKEDEVYVIWIDDVKKVIQNALTLQKEEFEKKTKEMGE